MKSRSTPQTLTGWYKLDQHKNVNTGIKAEGPLAEELVEYLLSIRPAKPGNAPIHFNPVTGRPFVDIRKQWERLMTSVATGVTLISEAAEASRPAAVAE